MTLQRDGRNARPRSKQRTMKKRTGQSLWRWLPRIEPLEDRFLPSFSPHLLADINTVGAGSSPQGFCSVGGVAYFSANDGAHGAELWKSNGTAAGTSMVADINRGGSSSNPRYLTNVNRSE